MLKKMFGYVHINCEFSRTEYVYECMILALFLTSMGSITRTNLIKERIMMCMNIKGKPLSNPVSVQIPAITTLFRGVSIPYKRYFPGYKSHGSISTPFLKLFLV